MGAMQNDMKPQQAGQKSSVPNGKTNTGETSGTGLSGVVDQAKQAAADVAGQAKDKVESQITAQKDRAVGSIGAVADALRQTGSTLRDKETGIPADLADRAAEQIDRVSGYLRNRTLGGLVSDVESFARREPAIFFGGAFTLGLLAARLLKSSSHHDDNYGRNEGALARRDESIDLRTYAYDDERATQASRGRQVSRAPGIGVTQGSAPSPSYGSTVSDQNNRVRSTAPGGITASSTMGNASSTTSNPSSAIGNPSSTIGNASEAKRTTGTTDEPSSGGSRGGMGSV
jgi:hypothetical protein